MVIVAVAVVIIIERADLGSALLTTVDNCQRGIDILVAFSLRAFVVKFLITKDTKCVSQSKRSIVAGRVIRTAILISGGVALR